MAAFSYSAPRFTEEDLQQEILSLSTEERELIDRELKGSDIIPNDEEDEERKESYFSRIEEELEQIPVEDKIEYEEALIHVPELVESESSVMKFLQKQNYNVQAAARNLVSYWEIRVKVFGRDRAFLPMTLGGAMQDEFDALSTGFFQILGTDAHGRAILFHEKPRANPQRHHRNSLLKCVFYILHVATSDLQIQKKGAVLINNFGTATMKDFDRLYAKTCADIGIWGTVQVKALHIPNSRNWLIPASLITPVMLAVISKYFRVRRNMYSSVEELEDYGLSLTEILSARSQIRNDEMFERWLEDQAQRERDNI
mmetsp:Transcript_15942/g.24826  ORF Transcript_15942/g.24826 Transcript_15942/m.24826 type:complete len:313 (+) Transcript_15942:73-1011(+)